MGDTTMSSNTNWTNRLLLRLFVFALAAPAGALAQSDDEQMEEITVTGTHIQGLDLEGAVQAVQLDRTAIDESGAESLGQLMQDLAISGGGTGTFSTSTAGASSSGSTSMFPWIRGVG